MKTNTYLLSFAIAAFASINILQAQGYSYKVDLQNINNDRVKVSCIVPKITNEKADFIFPNIIPGSYTLKEYGRYIDDFVAYDENGNRLKVKKADKYNFSIEDATRLQKVEYYVNDSWEEKGKYFIFQPGGTNIEAGKNFVINNFGFFGYIDGKKNIPYEITFLKPAGLKGYSYLKIGSENETTDKVKADNYNILADNPIMYCPPQDTTFKIGNSEVSICVYSENNKITTAQVFEIIKPLPYTLEKFLGALPVDRYLFMFYFANPTNVPITKGKGIGSGFGALEHNRCSFYFLPENLSMQKAKSMLTKICGHEFLHILTPLNLHSTEIEDFNFRVPVMSKHLWLYEGVTEYFSHLALLQDSTITITDFMERMREKINESSTFDIYSMTEMSSDITEKINQNRYRSVYSRGAILAMMLDMLIINKSDGKNSLKQVVMELSKKYGISKPFDDDGLIPEIESLTCPEVGNFFKEYIIGDKTPAYNTYFNLIGYDFLPVYRTNVYYFGRFGLNYNDDKKELLFAKVEENKLGIKENDILVSINDTPVDIENIDTLFKEYFSDNQDGAMLKVGIVRNGKEKMLYGTPLKAVKEFKGYIMPSENQDTKSENNLKKFMGKL